MIRTTEGVYLCGLGLATLAWARAGLLRRPSTPPRDPVDSALTLFFGCAIGVLPPMSIMIPFFSRWNFEVSPAVAAGATVVFALSVMLLWKSLHDLHGNWSPGPHTTQGQHLVTTGVYRHVRHPIYASYWLWTLSEPLLVGNWIGGTPILLAFPLLYFTRVEKEEANLLNQFGEDYSRYRSMTGRVLPRNKQPRH